MFASLPRLNCGMRLRTLGQLRLEGEKFRREKPLLLLAYLVLEGHKSRRYLAELFWPSAPNAMNNLAVSLSHLRRFGAADADDTRMWATVSCDARELREALRAQQVPIALALYQGAFADVVPPEDLGPDLEEWLLETRESLARELRSALLGQAAQEAGQAHVAEAARLAELAYRLPGCPPPDAEELPLLHSLFQSADHPLAATLMREARELGVTLEEVNKPELTATQFVGRESELRRLSQLRGGQWGWLRGASGMGKTALLRELALRHGWRLLPARSGLPYATLEPLLGDTGQPEAALLRQLSRFQTPLAVDDWETADPESRTLLVKLRALRPNYAVVLSGKREPPFDTEFRLDLTPLSAAELAALPGVFEATAGLPELVGAALRGESLEQTFLGRLQRLSETERRVYVALTLLPTPDLSVVRQALELDPRALVEVHRHLIELGLVGPTGTVRKLAAAGYATDQEPHLVQQVALALARALPTDTALPLYERAQAIWEAGDLKRIEQSYRERASDLLKRGLAREAAEVLEGSPETAELRLLRARALERMNSFKQSLELLDDLPMTADTQALTSRVLFKLGYPERAQQAAEKALALGHSLEAEAEALNTLGEIALRKGEAQEAVNLFSRSITLWQVTGQTSRWLWGMNNRAVAQCALGEEIEKAFQEVLEASNADLAVQAMVLCNIGVSYAKHQEIDKAENAFQQAIALGKEVGALMPLIHACNGRGVMYHSTQPALARQAYQEGITLCQDTGDLQITALLLANLAALDHDLGAWEQAIELLERGGYLVTAQEFRQYLETIMAR